MNLLEVLRESSELMLWETGPNTRGGRMVDKVNAGFSFSKNSQAAFSANVLLAALHNGEHQTPNLPGLVGWDRPWYPAAGSCEACSGVRGHQSASEYVCSGQNPLDLSIIEPNDEVMT